MRVLFWNTYNNSDINRILNDLIAENNISIVVLAEYIDNAGALITSLQKSGITMQEYMTAGCERIRVFGSVESVEPAIQTQYASMHIINKLCITSFFFITPTQIIMPAVHGTGSAFTFYIIMPVCRFNFFAADIAADSILNNHFSFLHSSDAHLLRHRIENNIAVCIFQNSGIPGRSNDKCRFLLFYFYRYML